MSDLSAWSKVGYIAACIAVPGAWGVFSAWLFSRGDRKRAAEIEPPSIDYMI